MPTIIAVAKTKLTPAELPVFRAWIQSRPGFRPDATAHRIREIDGAYMVARRPVPLADLVERWRSLGRPEVPARATNRQDRPGYLGKRDGQGAIRGSATRTGG